jgi:hypothetical protein
MVYNILMTKLKYLVCRGLIKNGERQDEESLGGRRRTDALRFLCKMNPSQALKVRGMVVRDPIVFMRQSLLQKDKVLLYRCFQNLMAVRNFNYILNVLPSSEVFFL